MGKFGEDLRKAREAKGIALEAIVQATKISIRHLQAVEADRFDQLPGGLFNKSIVRSYAKVVGLDQEAWVNRYLALTEKPVDPLVEDQTWIEFAQNVGRSRGKSGSAGPLHRMRWAGVGVLLLVVGGLSWFVWGYVQHKVAVAGVHTQAQALSLVR